MSIGFITYLRSPSTSGRSFVMAITSANNVTKVVINATGALQTAYGARTWIVTCVHMKKLQMYSKNEIPKHSEFIIRANLRSSIWMEEYME